MTDEAGLGQRVSNLERRMDVFEAVVPRDLAFVKGQSAENGEKLDKLLSLRDREEGREQGRKDFQAQIEQRRARDENRRIAFWTTAVLAIGSLLGCLIEAHWKIF